MKKLSGHVLEKKVLKTKKGYKIEISKNNLLDNDNSIIQIIDLIKSHTENLKKNKFSFTPNKAIAKNTLYSEITQIIIKDTPFKIRYEYFQNYISVLTNHAYAFEYRFILNSVLSYS